MIPTENQPPSRVFEWTPEYKYNFYIDQKLFVLNSQHYNYKNGKFGHLAQIYGRANLEKWLKGQSKQVAIVIASRAALRVLPYISRFPHDGRKQYSAIILPVFRAVSVSWSAASRSTQNIEVAAAFASAAVDNSSANAASLGNLSDAILASAAAASAVADTDPIYAATAAADLAASSLTTMWLEVSNDVSLIESGTKTRELINNFPLWQSGVPSELVEIWQHLKKSLLAAADENWWVWTHWYDARLNPTNAQPCFSPPNHELERQRAMIPNDVWKKGPSHLNSHIQTMIENTGCLKTNGDLEQKPAPYFFIESQNHAIDAETAQGEIHQPELATSLQNELIQQVTTLVNRLEGAQAVPKRVTQTLQRLLTALGGENKDKIDPGRLHMVSCALSADYDAWNTELGRKELPEDVFASLQEIMVGTEGLKALFSAITEMQSHLSTQAMLGDTGKKATALLDELLKPTLDNPDSVTIRARHALNSAKFEIAETEAIIAESNDNDVIAKAKMKRAKLLALHMQTAKNYASRLIKTAKKEASAFIKAADKDLTDNKGAGLRNAAALGTTAGASVAFIGGPFYGAVVGLAVLGLSGWRILASEIEAIKKSIDDIEKSNKNKNLNE